ncbi:MAG TPA: hypothetical protein VMY42_27020 [Thermoguttaceae bacterium]|nr:hypothetical protein [Thermoguttaceae bacterium]
MLKRTVFALVLLGLIVSLGYAGEPPAGEGKPDFYVGVCAHFGQNKGIPPLNLALMKTAGINSLRDELSWGGVERARGQYAIPPDKSAVFRRAAELGIAPMLIFDYANGHYDGGDRPRSPEALEGYTRYAEFLVKHFGPDVRLYEVWNEYDIGIGMSEPFRQGGSPEDYVRMLRHVYPRLKKLDPQITVIGGACTAGAVHRGWLEEIVKLGALDCCDVVSIHTYNYGGKGADRTPEAWWAWMQDVQKMLRAYNKDREVPLLITEMGWPTHSGQTNSTSPELSASYLGRLYLLARALPFLRGVWWYDYQDDGWQAEYNEDNFGIIRPDLTPKPSYYVMADVAELARRGECLGRVEAEDPAVWILRFRLDDQEIWAVWSADDRPRQILLETDTPDRPLVVHQLGHRPVERGWGHRPWASKGSGSQLVPNRASLVVDHRPWLIYPDMDNVRLVGATDSPGGNNE